MVPSGTAYDVRFARKFGLLFTIGLLCAENNLVDWPETWVYTAIEHCCLSAVSSTIAYRENNPICTLEHALNRLVMPRDGENGKHHLILVKSGKGPCVIGDNSGIVVDLKDGRYIGISDELLSLLQNSVSAVNLCDLRRAGCLGLRSAPA
jgi:hypothetical protein